MDRNRETEEQKEKNSEQLLLNQIIAETNVQEQSWGNRLYLLNPNIQEQKDRNSEERLSPGKISMQQRDRGWAEEQGTKIEIEREGDREELLALLRKEVLLIGDEKGFREAWVEDETVAACYGS